MPACPAFSAESVVVGQSERMRAVLEFVRLIANGMGNVLITGESGSGKEVVANLIHHYSHRRTRPFVPVSCAILTDTLIESELFGHDRGAFTGAVKDRPGRFELAHGGTIFLDDIDDVPLAAQVKLLRVLQTRTVERVGGFRPVPIDVRFVAGSKRDLKQLVNEARFREDLYYRLNVLPIALPPLRERREDIPALMEHFLSAFFGRRGQPAPPVTAEIRRAFLRYSWPGNVRELENLCERIAETCVAGQGLAASVVASMLHTGGDSQESAPVHEPESVVDPSIVAGEEDVRAVSLDDRLRELERDLISWALRVTRGNKSKAADLLRIKRSTLGDRISRCGLMADARDDDRFEGVERESDSRDPPRPVASTVTKGDSTDDWLQRIRAEFNEMPGMSVTLRQASRLWHLSEATCRSLLDTLLGSRFLQLTPAGAYRLLSDETSRPTPPRTRMLRFAAAGSSGQADAADRVRRSGQA